MLKLHFFEVYNLIKCLTYISGVKYNRLQILSDQFKT